MHVHVGEIHAEVSSVAPLSNAQHDGAHGAHGASGASGTPATTEHPDLALHDRLLDGLARMAWLGERVAADGFDD